MLLIVSCLILPLLCAAGPMDWGEVLNDIKDMRTCGVDMFNVLEVNPESVKMECQNSSGFDEQMWWRTFAAYKKYYKPMHPRMRRQEPEGDAPSWMKYCMFLGYQDEDDFDMEEEELLEPQNLIKAMGFMKIKMMKMKCKMMMMKMKKDKYKQRQEDFEYVKNQMAGFPEELLMTWRNNEQCKGQKMGYLDANGGVLKDALREKIESYIPEIADNEIVRQRMYDGFETCTANEEPSMVYMCVAAECVKLQRRHGSRYMCMES